MVRKVSLKKNQNQNVTRLKVMFILKLLYFLLYLNVWGEQKKKKHINLEGGIGQVL